MLKKIVHLSVRPLIYIHTYPLSICLYLSTYPSIHSFVCPLAHPSIFSFIFPTIGPYILLSINWSILSGQMSFPQSIFSSIYLSVHAFVHLSIHFSFNQCFVHPFVNQYVFLPSIHPPVCLFSLIPHSVHLPVHSSILLPIDFSVHSSFCSLIHP